MLRYLIVFFMFSLGATKEEEEAKAKAKAKAKAELMDFISNVKQVFNLKELSEEQKQFFKEHFKKIQKDKYTLQDVTREQGAQLSEKIKECEAFLEAREQDQQVIGSQSKELGEKDEKLTAKTIENGIFKNKAEEAERKLDQKDDLINKLKIEGQIYKAENDRNKNSFWTRSTKIGAVIACGVVTFVVFRIYWTLYSEPADEAKGPLVEVEDESGNKVVREETLHEMYLREKEKTEADMQLHIAKQEYDICMRQEEESDEWLRDNDEIDMRHEKRWIEDAQNDERYLARVMERIETAKARRAKNWAKRNQERAEIEAKVTWNLLVAKERMEKVVEAEKKMEELKNQKAEAKAKKKSKNSKKASTARNEKKTSKKAVKNKSSDKKFG